MMRGGQATYGGSNPPGTSDSLNKNSTDTMDRKKTNDVAELVRLGLPTFVNTLGKELQRDGSVQVNACELAQNRDKMIKYTCLAGLGALGLLAFGIAGLNNRI